MRAVELFVGAGGLALGVSRAGFRHLIVIDRDPIACATIRANQLLGTELLTDWPLCEADLSEFDFSALRLEVDLLSGGPPCQPFSVGGKHEGPFDGRDMFPIAVRAVRETEPKSFMFENVPGLLRPSLAPYLQYLLLQLTYPDMVRRPGDRWWDHRSRLVRHERSRGRQRGSYNLFGPVVLDAADYGVPQCRKRVFMVGLRNDIAADWTFPEPSHSRDALLWDQHVTGAYWERHRIASLDRPSVPDRLQPLVHRLRSMPAPPGHRPWLTVRDAIHDLPAPVTDTAPPAHPNHILRPGARRYRSHSGSLLDQPAKALKAGTHGVPGGENMLSLNNGHVRYFTLRECARLQSFPDNYVFLEPWSRAMRLIGNAVPVELSFIVAQRIWRALGERSNVRRGQFGEHSVETGQ